MIEETCDLYNECCQLEASSGLNSCNAGRVQRQRVRVKNESTCHLLQRASIRGGDDLIDWAECMGRRIGRFFKQMGGAHRGPGGRYGRHRYSSYNSNQTQISTQTSGNSSVASSDLNLGPSVIVPDASFPFPCASPSISTSSSTKSSPSSCIPTPVLMEASTKTTKPDKEIESKTAEAFSEERLQQKQQHQHEDFPAVDKEENASDVCLMNIQDADDDVNSIVHPTVISTEVDEANASTSDQLEDLLGCLAIQDQDSAKSCNPVDVTSKERASIADVSDVGYGYETAASVTLSTAVSSSSSFSWNNVGAHVYESVDAQVEALDADEHEETVVEQSLDFLAAHCCRRWVYRGCGSSYRGGVV